MASPGTDPFDRPADTGAEPTGGGAETAEEKAAHLRDRAKETASDLKRRAGKATADMRHRARSVAMDQKDAAAGRMTGVARALRGASDDLRDQGQPMIAEYSRHLAEGLESMADSLTRRDLDDLVGSVENFARARPAAFLGGAVVAGFALARFMKSSSPRRYAGAGAYPSDTAAAGMAGASMPGADATSVGGGREQGGL
jgi:hypothetical protein